MKATIYNVPEYTTPDRELREEAPDTLVIVGEESISQDEEAFLMKLLAAVKLDNTAKYHRIDMKTFDLDINAFIHRHSIKHVLIFGYEDDALPFNISIQRNVLYKFDRFDLTLTRSIPTLKDDVEGKKKLWMTLQKQFLS